MSPLDADQLALVEQYEDYTLEELLNLIGNLAAEYGDKELQRDYVLGLPNVFERGRAIVERARIAICASQQQFAQLLIREKETLEMVEWAGMIADALLAVTVTGGIPPLTIAVALGKISNRSVAKLCSKR